MYCSFDLHVNYSPAEVSYLLVNTYKTTLISSVFTRNRFEEILSLLHFKDYQGGPPKTSYNYDKLFKIRALINHFNQKKSVALMSKLFLINGVIRFAHVQENQAIYSSSKLKVITNNKITSRYWSSR
jgi:hypothetical protein